MGHPSQNVSSARVRGLLTHNTSGGRSRARSCARKLVACDDDDDDDDGV